LIPLIRGPGQENARTFALNEAVAVDTTIPGSREFKSLIRGDGHKLIFDTVTGTVKLYYLPDDPGEESDLAETGSYDPLIADMMEQLEHRTNKDASYLMTPGVYLGFEPPRLLYRNIFGPPVELIVRFGTPAAKKPYVLGDRIDFSQDTVWSKFQSGWHEREPWGRWAAGHRASLIFFLEQPVKSDLELVMEGLGNITEQHHQRVLVDVNGHHVGETTLSPASPSLPVFVIPREAVAEASIIKVVLRMPDAIAPAALGIHTDERALGLGLRSVTIKPHE
jgi:hypothetical protein